MLHRKRCVSSQPSSTTTMAEETSLLSLDRFEQAFSALSLAERRLVLERCLQGCSLSEIVTVTEVCRPHLKFCDFFSMLPQLVVSMILDYLPLRDLVSCAQVSKNWESALTETRSLWLRAKPWPCPKPLVTDGHPYPIARYELQRWARLDHRNGGGIEIRDLCWGCDGTVKPIMAFTWNRDRLLVACKLLCLTCRCRANQVRIASLMFDILRSSCTSF